MQVKERVWVRVCVSVCMTKRESCKVCECVSGCDRERVRVRVCVRVSAGLRGWACMGE